MYYSVIVILAALILLIENQDILFRRSSAFDQPAWRMYRWFLFAVLVYYATDIVWGLFESQKLATLLFVDTSVYFIAMAVGVWRWTQYAVTYLDEGTKFERIVLYTGRILAAAVALLVVANVFVPVLFSVDASCTYHPLAGRYANLGTQILLLFAVSAYALASIAHGHCAPEKAKRYRTMAHFGLTMVLFLLIQIWFPLLPLYSIAYMLGTCLMRAFVLGDEKEEYRRGLEEAEKVVELKHSITSLLDNMPDMSFSKDAETGVYLACNQAFAEYAHKPSPEDVVGLTDAQIFDPETAQRFAEGDRIALSMDESYVFFEDVPDAAGNQRQLQTTKLQFVDGSGRMCVLGLCQDVTDTVRIQHDYAMTKEAYEQARSTGVIYSHIAQTLARSYTYLYYVNLDTGEFIEYRTDDNGSGGGLTEDRRGQHFFDECKTGAEQFVHPEDRDTVVRGLNRQTLVDELDRNGTFMMTYRLMHDGSPTYVSMKVSRMEDDERFIVIGVSNIDEQMKRQRAEERMAEERVAFARINALVGDFICLYVVVPETGRYREYSAAAGFERFTLPKEGMDFFDATRELARDTTYPDDLERFLSLFTRERVLTEAMRGGVFALTYRLVLDDKPFYVQLKAAMVEEKEGRRLVVGLNDIDSNVRQEKDYERRLAQAQHEVNVDALTGVKNKRAYLDAEARLNRQIEERRAPAFAVVILDVNDLKRVNDTEGHKAGDQWIRDACKVVCDTFEHSPVFRVGGDEFVVISQGGDYERIDELVGKMGDYNAAAMRDGRVVVACGMARYEGEANVASVFERADQRMYENKSSLKTDGFAEA